VLGACRYVGGAPGKIDLYVGKEVVRRSAPFHARLMPDLLVDRNVHKQQMCSCVSEQFSTGIRPGGCRAFAALVACNCFA
jgi:hypothetical protein